MKLKHIFVILIVNQFLFAQPKNQILKSNTNIISIKEDNNFYKDVWEVSPKTNLDVLVTNKFAKTKKITFYSDIDSVSFTVKPNKKYNFVVLLNGEEAHTQIDTDINKKPSLEPKLYYTRLKTNYKTDTIPFILGNDNRIHLKGKVNNSDTLDILFDTGAGACVITSSIINQKVKLKIDGSQKNEGTDGVAIVASSSENTIEISNLKWENVPLLSIDYKNPTYDVVLGWIAFENKIIEIVYEKNNMIIHNSLPELSVEYSKLDFKLLGGIPYVNLKLIVNGKESEGWFDFDTGSNGTLVIGQKFASQNLLNNSMELVGKTKFLGSAGIGSTGKSVILPKLKIGDFEMYQIPLTIQDNEIENVDYNENIGNKILKRFNAIIDFKNKYIYLKPNKLFYTQMLGN